MRAINRFATNGALRQYTAFRAIRLPNAIATANMPTIFPFLQIFLLFFLIFLIFSHCLNSLNSFQIEHGQYFFQSVHYRSVFGPISVRFRYHILFSGAILYGYFPCFVGTEYEIVYPSAQSPKARTYHLHNSKT